MPQKRLFPPRRRPAYSRFCVTIPQTSPEEISMLGIIGGTGLTQLENLKITRRQLIRTPYGEPSGPLTFGDICGHTVVFLPRHGSGHTIAPHMVNYHAHMWALNAEGVRSVRSEEHTS